MRKTDAEVANLPEPGALLHQYTHKGGRPSGGRAASHMETLFWGNEGPLVHKWHHYLPIYERYFAPFRNKPVRMLEIGVFKGGSLNLWRTYFGPQLVLYGIDIDPACAELDGIDGQVRIGSQDDPEFLERVVTEMGGVDLVLDDGSHVSRHIRASFEYLFPRLSNGGIYMIEDLHAAYWAEYGAGYASADSFMNDVKTMIDDMHHWYHSEGQRIAAARGTLAALHVHDSVVVLEKDRVDPPRHSQVGTCP